jgi:hypothetical protein
VAVVEVMEGGGARLRHESLLVARNALHRHVGRRDRRGRVGRDRVLAVAWLAVQAARRVHEHRERDLHRRGRGREEACEGWRARRARRGRGEGRGSRAAGAAHVVLAQAIVNGLLGEGDRFAAAVVVERIRLHAARGGRLREEVCPAGGAGKQAADHAAICWSRARAPGRRTVGRRGGRDRAVQLVEHAEVVRDRRLHWDLRRTRHGRGLTRAWLAPPRARQRAARAHARVRARQGGGLGSWGAPATESTS